MIHLINEENSELRNRKFPLPDGIRKQLQSVLDNYNGDKTVDGYHRLNNILSMDGIKYSEMKRIKNFFDHYTGSDKSDEFILNGGEPMKLWVNNTLNTATKSIEDYKQAKKDAGIKNAFIKPHEKERQIRKNKPTQVKFQTNNATKALSNGEIMKYESKSPNNKKLNENTDILKYIPKRVFNTIEKFNQEVQKQKEYMDDEYCLKERDDYDYTISPITINDKGEMEYDLVYNDFNKTTHHETIPLVKEYEGEIWFDDEEYKDQLRHYKADLKRGLKFFQEYGSKYSDYEEGGEDRVMNRINNESKKGITIIISEEQLRDLKIFK